MIKAIIVDDENLARSLISDYIDEVSFIKCAGCYANPLEAVEAIQDRSVDLVFMDIQMPKMSGLKLLSQLPNHPFVVFTTAFAEHALEGYNFNTVDYLVKPVSFDRFLKASLKVRKLIARSTSSISKQETKRITIQSGGRQLQMRHDELYYVSTNGDYVELHMVNGSLQLRMSMRKLLELGLPLRRIHKSFAVNPEFVQLIDARTVVIQGVELPIGRCFKDAFKEQH